MLAAVAIIIIKNDTYYENYNKNNRRNDNALKNKLTIKVKSEGDEKFRQN